MVHLRELGVADAPVIARLEARLHRPELRDGAERLQAHMAQAEAEGVSLCFGLFDDEVLVGYLLCFGFEPTAFPGEEGEAIYAEDVAVLPGYPRGALLLIEQLTRKLDQHFPGVALEAHALETVLPTWLRHAKVFASIGLHDVRHAPTGERVEGVARYVLRWSRQLPGTAAAPARDLEQMLRRLEGHRASAGDLALEFKVVRGERDWSALEPLWDELLLATPGHTVFQSYAYQRLWWRHFSGGNQLFIVLVLHEGKVRGIAPLQIRTVPFHGRLCRELAFIGTRWEVDRPVFLVPGERALILSALAGFLVRQRATWDIAHFHEQQDLDAIDAGFAAAGCLTTRARDSDCAYLDTAAQSWDAFLAGKSQKFRKNIKAAGRKLQDLGEVAYAVYRTPAEVRQQLEIYRTIEARSWKSAEEVGVSRSEEYFAFYLELAALFAPRGGFVVRMLTVDGRAVAGTFGLEHDGTYYSLQIAHDREFDRCSPGTYLEAIEIEECFSGPCREYEFLGGFLNNKARWTATFRHTTQLYVLRRTPFLTLVHLVFLRLKPWLKELVRPYMKSWQQHPPR